MVTTHARRSHQQRDHPLPAETAEADPPATTGKQNPQATVTAATNTAKTVAAVKHHNSDAARV